MQIPIKELDAFKQLPYFLLLAYISYPSSRCTIEMKFYGYIGFKMLCLNQSIIHVLFQCVGDVWVFETLNIISYSTKRSICKYKQDTYKTLYVKYAFQKI